MSHRILTQAAVSFELGPPNGSQAKPGKDFRWARPGGITTEQLQTIQTRALISIGLAPMESQLYGYHPLARFNRCFHRGEPNGELMIRLSD